MGSFIGGKAGSKLSKKFGFCFVAGTLILMGDGSSKPIEQVKAGDVVLSKNEKTGKVEKQKVTDSWSKTAPATLLLTFADGTRVETTDEHPFYVNEKGFTPAAEIGLGSSIVTRAGPALRLVAKAEKDAPQAVFNFSVDQTNSYFVSDKALWVHNARNCGGKANPQDVADEVHDALPSGAKGRRTTGAAIATDPNGQDVLLVAGSGKYLTRPQQAIINQRGGIYVRGTGQHAEVNLLGHAARNGLNIKSIAASRPVCPNCAAAINRQGGINILSPLKK